MNKCPTCGAGLERWFATRCRQWGRAIWRAPIGKELSYSRAFVTWKLEHETPVAADLGSGWYMNLHWPEGLELGEGEMIELSLPPRWETVGAIEKEDSNG